MSIRKTIALFTAALLLTSAPGFAAEKNSLSFWVKNTGSKLQSVSKKNKNTAVAGVKGAAEKAPDDLYWKGVKPDVTEDEIDALESVVEHVTKGETDAAIKELEAFIAKYPDSALTPDAREGLTALKTENK